MADVLEVRPAAPQRVAEASFTLEGLVLERGLATGDTLARAQLVQEETGEPLDTVLTRLGLVSEDDVKDLSPREILALVFLPGFTTKEEATQLSGRGVGMDIVKTNIAKLGGIVDITSEVESALNGVGEASAVLVFVPHTTAGVTINEHADPAVARDFEAALERLVGEDWGWQHVEDGEENAPSHIRAALMGSQVLVPLRDGRLALGTWQGIFFCELDGPRERSVYITPLT